MCKAILTVVVGSQLHGLARPESDMDIRGVFINDIRDIVNPFEKPEDKRFVVGGGKDDTASELRKFIIEVTKGGPNAVEILFSNMEIHSGTTDIGRIMQQERMRFINTQNVFNAYKNYAENQLNKMSVFAPDVRTPKFAVAYIRTLLNGIELLRDGIITNPIPENFALSGGETLPAKRLLSTIKFCPFEEFASVREEATRAFARLQIELATVFYKHDQQVEDREWIVDFVASAYLD
jgi:predicted nucleotidyltransferase